MRKDYKKKLYKRKHHQLHREANLAKKRKYYRENREKILAAMRERYDYKPKRKKAVCSDKPRTPKETGRSKAKANAHIENVQATHQGKECCVSRQPCTLAATVSVQTETSITELCQSKELLIPFVNNCTSERKGMHVLCTCICCCLLLSDIRVPHVQACLLFSASLGRVC